MLFAARKMWFHPTLSQPTILIIVDRDQLEDQISGQFYRTNTSPRDWKLWAVNSTRSSTKILLTYPKEGASSSKRKMPLLM